jgi:hypothetical protein
MAAWNDRSRNPAADAALAMVPTREASMRLVLYIALAIALAVAAIPTGQDLG